jgi:FtsH-binding integral membrane protein
MGKLMTLINKASQTNCPWGTQRSHLIGVSAVFYAFPAVLDLRDGSPRFVLWLLQAWACFWSDYLDSGRFGYSHAFDKALASSLTLYVVALALAHRGPLFVVALALPTFGCYGLGTAARKAGDFARYARWHALWHLCGGCVAVLTLQSAR